MLTNIRQAVTRITSSLTGRLTGDSDPKQLGTTPRPADTPEPEPPAINPISVRENTARNRARRLIRVAARRTPSRRPRQTDALHEQSALPGAQTMDNPVYKTRASEESPLLPDEKIGLGPTVFAIDRSGSLGSRNRELALAENFVAAATKTFEEAGATENVAVTETINGETNVVVPFLLTAADADMDILTEGKASGHSPLTDLIQMSDTVPGADPETIIVLTDGYPDRPQEMMNAVMDAEATVMFIGVGKLRFTDAVSIKGTSQHCSTIASKKGVTDALTAFFHR